MSIPVFSKSANNHNNTIQNLLVKAMSNSTKQSAQSIDSITKMIDLISEGIFVIDQLGLIHAVNPLAANFIGDNKPNILGKSWGRFLHESCREDFEYMLTNWHKSKTKNHLKFGPKEVLLSRADGTWLEVDMSLSSLTGLSECTDNLLIGVLHNLAEHKKEYGELRRKAYTDHLTGLANRYSLDKTLKDKWQDCSRNDLPLSLIIIDVDYFKCFNDQFGHVNGDKCLKLIAQVIEGYLPSRDCIAARYGGEEFAVILPHCDIHNAGGIAGLIQHKISEMNFVDIGLPGDFRVTVSQGVACQEDNKYVNSEALICAADGALYKAKSAGRNRIKKVI